MKIKIKIQLNRKIIKYLIMKILINKMMKLLKLKKIIKKKRKKL